MIFLHFNHTSICRFE